MTSRAKWHLAYVIHSLILSCCSKKYEQVQEPNKLYKVAQVEVLLNTSHAHHYAADKGITLLGIQQICKLQVVYQSTFWLTVRHVTYKCALST